MPRYGLADPPASLVRFMRPPGKVLLPVVLHHETVHSDFTCSSESCSLLQSQGWTRVPDPGVARGKEIQNSDHTPVTEGPEKQRVVVATTDAAEQRHVFSFG